MTASSYGNLPKLSIIMVMRNAASVVTRALDSLILQHYPKLEVIVWDGMSDDDTPEVVARYPDLITRMVRERDSGPPDAYNRALELTTGDFIGYLNADDAFEPGTLWAVAEAILKNPQAEMVSTGILYYTVKNGQRVVTGLYAAEKQLELTLENVCSELPTFMLSRFLHRDLAFRAGPYNTDRSIWYISTDREWMARLALSTCRNVIVPHALYAFDMHPQSISSNPEAFTRIIEEHILIADSLLQKPDLTDKQRHTLMRWKKRQLAYGLWKSLMQFKWDKLKLFLREGNALAGLRFLPLAVLLLLERLKRKLGLMMCRGIDRG